jgi:hypothetical protein
VTAEHHAWPIAGNDVPLLARCVIGAIFRAFDRRKWDD